MSKFIYLLNAMENAAQAADPSTAGYGLARRAVLEYVEKLESAQPRIEICHAPSSSGRWHTDGERECYTCGAKCLPGESIVCRYAALSTRAARRVANIQNQGDKDATTKQSLQ